MKTILITGTNRGIGLGLVRVLLASKTTPEHLIATCRKPEEATELRELEKSNPNLHIIKYDVTDFDALGKFYEEVNKIIGKHGLNVLINNAGIYGKSLKIGYLKPEAMLETFSVNTVAPVMLTKELLPLLKTAAEKNGDKPLGSWRAAVVNITSQLGSIAENNVGGYYPYRSSKAALNACTRSLNIDLKCHNILATCIHPGWVKTDMGGPKAPMEVSDSCKSIVDTITNLNESQGGCFLNYDGKALSW